MMVRACLLVCLGCLWLYVLGEANGVEALLAECYAQAKFLLLGEFGLALPADLEMSAVASNAAAIILGVAGDRIAVGIFKCNCEPAVIPFMPIRFAV
jgi:hypothetical protein